MIATGFGIDCAKSVEARGSGLGWHGDGLVRITIDPSGWVV